MNTVDKAPRDVNGVDAQYAQKEGNMPKCECGPGCQWCREVGQEDMQYHALWEEHEREQLVYHHVEMIAFNGECSRCHMHSDAPNQGCRKQS
jgi:hypothetical protein